MQRLLLAQMLTCVALAASADQVGDAINAMQQGDLHSAESLLQGQLAKQPRDPAALSVLAVVLDQEHKYAAAESAYERALEIDAGEPGLLNNYGNHLLAGGHQQAARRMFQRTVGLDPSNRNANIQLAKMAIDGKRGTEALSCLRHLSPADRTAPEIDLLFGMALSAARQYAVAEEYFKRAADSQPDSFEAQYDLGLAASKAKHLEAADQALKRALKLRPDNADVLYDLAVVNLEQGKGIEAIALLARGSASAPDRADLQLLLAQSTSRLGYFEDSIQAWDKYLRLKPRDEVAKRERAFAQSAIGRDSEAALADLAAFVEMHPKDPLGHYELGTALSVSDPGRAGRELSGAIQLDPMLTSAYVARGLLAYRQGNTNAAAHDFAAAAKEQPGNARILDRLGEAYVAEDRLDEALPVLKRAAQISPDDPSVLLHLGRALTKSGQRETAANVFARYRTLERPAVNTPHETGLIDFLSLPPGEQQARYRAGVERVAAAEPENAEAQVKYLEVLLSDGEKARAADVCRRLLDLRPDGERLAAAGRALLDAGQYSAAEAFLDGGIRAAGSLPSLELELAQARLYTAGPQAALAEMNRIDRGARTPSFYTARAEMLGMMDSTHGSSQP